MRWPDGGPGKPDLWDEVDEAVDHIQEPIEASLSAGAADD